MDTENLLRMPLDELYARLAGELEVDQFGPSDLRRMRARAQTWMRANHAELQRRICPMAQKHNESAVDFAAIADAISTLVGGPACLTVAAIIMKVGLKQFCEGAM